MATNPLALQMYTLRDDAQKDFKGTLRAVAEMGYRAVELAGLGGLSAKELRAELDALGVRVSSAHIPLDRLEGSLDGAIEEMKTLGGTYIVCPWLPPDRRPDAEGYKRLAHTLAAIGEKVSAAGLQFGYHNHDFELQQFGDTTGLHILKDNSPADALCFELDAYWAAYAGLDPVKVIEDFAGRLKLVHLKDMKAGDRVFAEVGHGTLDIPGIIAASERVGVEWFVVEQDRCERPPLESVKMSLDYLKRLGRA